MQWNNTIQAAAMPTGTTVEKLNVFIAKYNEPVKHSAHEILDLPSSASLEEIKSKFKILALQYHPDKNPESLKEKAAFAFNIINQAYTEMINERGPYAKIRNQKEAVEDEYVIVEPADEPEEPSKEFRDFGQKVSAQPTMVEKAQEYASAATKKARDTAAAVAALYNYWFSPTPSQESKKEIEEEKPKEFAPGMYQAEPIKEEEATTEKKGNL